MKTSKSNKSFSVVRTIRHDVSMRVTTAYAGKLADWRCEGDYTHYLNLNGPGVVFHADIDEYALRLLADQINKEVGKIDAEKAAKSE